MNSPRNILPRPVTGLRLAAAALLGTLGLTGALRGQGEEPDPLEPSPTSPGGGFQDGATGAGQIVTSFTIDRSVFGGGNFYWAIAEVESSEIVARGKMDVEGIDNIILRPRTSYRMLSFYEETLSLGTVDFTTPAAGRTFQIACMDYIDLDDPPDSDADGLPDPLEPIAGTNPDNPDTDGDGFADGAEVLQGRDPLDGFFAATGIIASGPTPASAIDICTINNLAVVACGSAGLVVFNVRSGEAPTRIAQVDTPGDARGVACFSNYIAVADGAAGLAVVDVSDPPSSRILHQLRFGSPVNAVTSRGNMAFAGLENGIIVMVDMITGVEVGRTTAGIGRIQDLGQRRGFLYALAQSRLHTYEILDGELDPTSNVSAPGGIGAGQIRQRIVMGDDFLFTLFTSGFNEFDLSDFDEPELVATNNTAAQGWKQIVPNGTGLGVATLSANSTPDGAHDVSLYRLTGEFSEANFVTTFPTPGRAIAVSLYNGLAYVADAEQGIQVINFLAFDTAGNPPSIGIEADSINGAVEEGKVFTVRTPVDDDVMVRSVEFFINDEPVALDGNFPFELGLISPAIPAGESNPTFTVHAVASDTGGNTSRSPTLTLELVPDATPPRVRAVNPPAGSISGRISSFLAVFSEPIEESLITSRVRLRRAGPDDRLDTADDETVSARMEYSSETFSLSLTFPGDAQPGLYEFRVDRSLTDLAGNPMTETFTSSFRIYGFEDSDADGVPDDLEEALGLDPNNPDTDGDGIRDGMEDSDNDGLPNVGEVLLNTDPFDNDSDDDGILDGAEDGDLDGLNDGDEVRNGTSPTEIDSDGDGIADPDEIREGTNPLDRNSRPLHVTSSGLVAFLNGYLGTSEEPIRYVVTSPVTSFLNALPTIPDQEQTFVINSPVASYLNAVPPIPEGGIDYVTNSPIASYLNAIPDSFPNEEDYYVASPVVTFENQ